MMLRKILKNNFKFEQFRTGQREVIEAILQKKDVVAMLPTGSGKSLCYQLPGYFFAGHILIVSPLLSLMQDQVDQMKSQGHKRVIALNSFLPKREKSKVLSNLHNYKYIFISPEMLQIESIITAINRLKIDLFVIDEAHCISQWGYDFRPDYQSLGFVKKKLGNPPTLALTATATKLVQEDIKTTLSLSEPFEFISTVDRPNISIAVEQFESQDEKLVHLLKLTAMLKSPGIIYFSSKKIAEEIAEILRNNGHKNTIHYHGDLLNEDRILIQQQFINNQIDIICATSAFGMGINKDNVRFIIHYHLPQQLESYVQEIGRAGRDQLNSIAIMLYVPGDEIIQYRLAESDYPSEEQLDILFNLIKEQGLTEQEIVDICQLTELQWRLIKKFIESNQRITTKEILQLKEQFNKRRLMKLGKINDFVKWINSSQCFRKKILQYFDEQPKIDVEQCCSNCHLDYTMYEQQLCKNIEKTFAWRDYLKQLFYKSNSAGDNE